MTKRFAVMAIIVAAIAVLGSPAWAEQGPRERVEDANRRIHDLVSKQAPEASPAAAQRDEQLRALVSDLLDVDEMARQALGREWDQRSEAERREYLDLMRQLVERSYLRQARERTDYALSIGDVRTRGGEAEVETELRFQTRGRQETIEVVYTLALRDGRWKVTDIETDGASMVSNYRTSFRRIMRQDGFAELLNRMRRRLAEGESEL